MIAQATSVHHWLLAITQTVHSVRRPSTRSSRSCFSKQFRQRHPVASLAFKTGIGPCGNSAHQQSPSGLQFMGASQRAHRVSITLFSLVVPILSSPAPTLNFSTHFVPRLTRLPICGKLNVYAAWFLRGCSVTGECPGQHAPGAKRPNSPAVISLNGSKVHT